MIHGPGRSTIAIHGRPTRRADWTPVVAPVVQSTTFINPVGGEEEVLYTRYGNNPNQVELARKYAMLEGAEDAVFVSSGMAATALAHLAILRPGDHLLASRWIYGGTQRLFDEEFGRLGIAVSYVDPDQQRQWRKMIRKTTPRSTPDPDDGRFVRDAQGELTGWVAEQARGIVTRTGQRERFTPEQRRERNRQGCATSRNCSPQRASPPSTTPARARTRSAPARTFARMVNSGTAPTS